ncbi:uncharacterized protein LOC135490836 isoform X2 [Lineus longissimus]|uniref:uncharacterized protein LOC135490836 isoform X2 n=1 Tax=Lineus longissimus TaxID=88925 RepID=UPI002B4E903B
MTVFFIVCVVCSCLIVVDVVLAQPRCSDCSPLKHLSCVIPSQEKYNCGADTPRRVSAHDTPGPARNLKVKSIVNPSNLLPSFIISWEPPSDSSIRYLTGFEITIFPLTPEKQTCRLLNLTVRLERPNDQNVVFTYPPEGCYIPGLLSATPYTIFVQSLPVSSLGPEAVTTNATTKTFKDIPYKWSTTILILNYSPQDHGRAQVWFVAAPDKYNFTSYSVSLYPDGPNVVVREPYNFHNFKGLCPQNGSKQYSVRIKPTRKNADGQMVCVNEFGLEKNDCMTTREDFNITYGDPNICPVTTPFPMIQVIGGTCGATLVLIVIISILVMRRKRNDTYCSTWYTTQNFGQNQQTSPSTSQVYQTGNLQNTSSENPCFEPEREHRPISNGHAPSVHSEGVQSQRTEGDDDDSLCSKDSSIISSKIGDELDDTTGKYYYPDISWKAFS